MQTHPHRISFAALLLALALACLGGGCMPSGPKALLQGAELVRKGKYEAAIVRLKIAKDLLPNDARAWNYLGLAYHGAGHYGEAIIAYQRAQQLDHNLAEARYNLGELFLEQGNPVSAADEFSVFTALRPKSVEGWLRLGDAHLQNQRLDRAQTMYHAALELKKDNPEALNGIGLILLQRKNPRDAYRLFVEANKYDADYPPAILNMAVVAHQHLDALSTARSKYREYLIKSPGAPNVAEVQAAIRQLDAVLNPPVQTMERVQLAGRDSPPLPVVTNTSKAQSRDTMVAHTGNADAEVKTATTPAPPPVRTNLATTAAAATTTTTTTNANTEAAALVRSAPPATNKPVQVASATSVPRTNRVQTPTPPPDRTAGRVESALSAPTLATEATIRSETPPTTNEPAASPGQDEPPLEVVTITETPVVPATEIPPAGEIQPAASTSVSEPPVAAARQPEVLPRLEEPKPTREKRGFFQRINPVNLFRSDKADEAEQLEAVNASRRSDDELAPQPRSAPTATPGNETVSRPTELASREDVTVLPEPASGLRYPYGRIRKPEPKDRAAAERLFERGVDAMALRDPGGATSFFQAAVEADPTYFAAHYNLGLVAYSTGQTQRALSAFETALVLDSTSAEARYNFALTLQKAGYAADAAHELEQVLARKPDETRAMLLLGNVYAQDLGRVNDARRMYQQVLEREPKHPQATAIRYWLSEHP